VDDTVVRSNLDKPSFKSFSRTSEDDVMLSIIPELEIELGYKMAEVEFTVTVESLDFIGNVPGREISEGFVMDVATSAFFIIKTVSLVVGNETVAPRCPKLRGEIQLVKTDDTMEK